MNLQRKKLRPGRTPHLDPLPFRRGEEKPAALVRSAAEANEPAQHFLSPIGGEDQDEGATALTSQLGAFRPTKSELSLKWIRRLSDVFEVKRNWPESSP